jgi:DNA modification methylase
VTVWDVDRANKNEYHPTQKPLELASRAIKNSTEIEGLVLDLFLGSGSTLIACEQTNRICYGMEIDPKYVTVILDRWEKLTGKKAEKIHVCA